MSVLNNSNAIETGGYNIQRSLRFRSSASAYLSRTQSAGANTTTYTWSAWIKRGVIPASDQYLFGFTTSGTVDGFYFNSAGGLTRWTVDTSGTVTRVNLTTTQVFRDPSAWYHVVFVWDTTQATASNRCKMYVNGVQITSFSTATYPAQNWGSYSFNPSYSMTQFTGYGGPFDGYVAELNFIDGQALTPSSFGQTDPVTGVWQPKKYTGTYGTNGFYLDFKDNTSATTLAYDKSGNGNNWTANNISTTAGVTYDSMLDVPTLTSASAANYCVLNPLAYNASYCLDGNLAFAGANATSVRASFAMPTTGKWYWEVNQVDAAVNYVGFGLADAALTNGSNNSGTTAAGMWSLYPTTTMYYSLNGATGVNTGVSPPALGGCMAAAYDADTGNFWFGYAASGAGSITWFASGNPATGTNPLSTISAGRTLFPYMSSNNTTANKSAINFGQRPFNCTPPTGFKALNTFNLPDPVIKKPNQYMDVSTWTGTSNSSARTISGLAFQPDLVWAKARSIAYSHTLFDSVRGTGKQLRSNETIAEVTNDTNGYVSSFNADGFTSTPGATDNIYFNQSGQTYVGWQWKKGATPGFDIVTYTQANPSTLSHSLGVKPAMMIIKSRSDAENWVVWHQNLVNQTTYALQLNTTTAQFSATSLWNNTAPTSTQFTVGIGAVNNGQTAVAYLFAEIAGFSKFGSYTGNGSADGPFVYCGFRPKYVLIKGTNVAEHWMIFDSARNTYNYVDRNLFANLSNAEESGTPYIDFLSNGFKLRANQTRTNGTYDYIYAAFAENPFKYSLAR